MIKESENEKAIKRAKLVAKRQDLMNEFDDIQKAMRERRSSLYARMQDIKHAIMVNGHEMWALGAPKEVAIVEPPAPVEQPKAKRGRWARKKGADAA